MYVAREIAGCIREKQSAGEMCVLGMTTGKSPVGLFRALVELHKKEGAQFSQRSHIQPRRILPDLAEGVAEPQLLDARESA